MQPWQIQKIVSERSFLIAVESMERIGDYCDKIGVRMRVNVVNGDYKHWQFFFMGRTADYWPLSKNLVLNKDWRNPVPSEHVTGVIKVLRLLRLQWALTRTVPLPKLREPAWLEAYMRRFVLHTLTKYSPGKPRWNRQEVIDSLTQT